MTVEPFAERRKNGLRHVVFDPHMGAAGEKADLWVPIRPGTDAAAALAIAYVLVHEENLIDIEFLANRTNGPSLVDLDTKRISSTRRQGIRCTWIPTARRSLTIGAAPPTRGYVRVGRQAVLDRIHPV